MVSKVTFTKIYFIFYSGILKYKILRKILIFYNSTLILLYAKYLEESYCVK